MQKLMSAVHATSNAERKGGNRQQNSREENVCREHRAGVFSKACCLLLMLAIIMVLARSAAADNQACTNISSYYCGGLSPSTPISERCLPRVLGLSTYLAKVDTLSLNPLQKRLTFMVRYRGKGFHTYLGHCFNVSAMSKIDDYASQNVGGSSTMSSLPSNAYGVCATIGGGNCYLVYVNSSCRELKFWARAWQRASQGYDECGCTSDTLRLRDPINLQSGRWDSLMISPQADELGPIPCQAQTADPINVTNGNMYLERNDVTIPSDLGLPITFSRHYNSYPLYEAGALSSAWRHSYEYNINRDTLGNYVLVEASGRTVIFKRHDLIAGVTHEIRYDPPYGIPYRFKFDTLANVFTITLLDDVKLIFQDTGLVDSLEDLSGNRIRLFYNGAILDSIRNASGRKLVFGYSSGVLKSVLSSTGDTVAKYDYDSTGNLLTRASYGDNGWESYRYGDSAYDNQQIVEITNSDSVTSQFAYDTSGLADEYFVADSLEKVSLDWQPPTAGPTCPPYPQPETTLCTAIIQNGFLTSQFYTAQPVDDAKREVMKRQNADCSDCATRYLYDDNGMKKVVTYGNGATDSAWYDARGNMIGWTRGANTSTKQQFTWTYDSTFNRPTVSQRPSTAKSGDFDILQYIYDSHGNPTKLVESGWKNSTSKFNDTSWFTYNAGGQLIKSDGARRDVGDTVKYVYYANGDLRYIIEANADTTEYGERDNLGRRTWMKSSGGDTTRFAFDLRGRLKSIISQAGTNDSTVVAYTFNFSGDPILVSSPAGANLSLHYNRAGHLDSIADPLGAMSKFAYDSVGNRISERGLDAGGVLRHWQSFAYDTKHQLTRIAGLYGDTTRFGYSAVGTIDTTWDALSHRTIARRDSLRRVIASVEPDGGDSIKTLEAYDTHDNLIKLTDPDGDQFVFRYDDKDRLVFDSSAISGITLYGYDAADNLTWKKNAAGDSIAFKYDALNRLTAALYPDSQNTRLIYDGTEFAHGTGRLYKDSTAASWVKYQYNADGLLYKEFRKFAQDTATYLTICQYDINGNVDTLTYPSDRKVAYLHDSSDNVIQVRLSSNGQWTTLVDSVRYAPLGDAEFWKLGNGVRINVGLDSSYRVDSISTSPDSVSRLKYLLDANGNITDINDGLDSMASRSFAFDDIYRLTEARSRDYPDTLQKYGYAKNGNRDTLICFTDSTIDTSTYSYTSDRLTQINGARNVAFTYDALGNVTRVIRGSDTTTFQYNKAGMLTGINNGGVATCAYDAWRRRISKVVGGSTVTKYVPDGSGQVLAEYGVTDGWQRDYIYLNGQLVARVSSVAGEGILYVINDHLGTPVALVDSVKTVRWRARWYPFGEIYSEQVSIGNDVRFPGQLRDDESGLYYNWHRYYSPELGRYYQSDPIGLEGGVNQYAYAGGNPLSYIDPEGLFTLDDILAAMPTPPHWWVNRMAGMGDVLLGGFGDELRNAIGAGGVVDRCCDEYLTGKIYGVVITMGVGLNVGLGMAGKKTNKTEFSHFIPKRYLEKIFGRDFRNRLNGNYITPERHAELDKFRNLEGMTKDMKKPYLQRFIFRFPRAVFFTGVGATLSLLGILDEECECKKK